LVALSIKELGPRRIKTESNEGTTLQKLRTYDIMRMIAETMKWNFIWLDIVVRRSLVIRTALDSVCVHTDLEAGEIVVENITNIKKYHIHIPSVVERKHDAFQIVYMDR